MPLSRLEQKQNQPQNVGSMNPAFGSLILPIISDVRREYQDITPNRIILRFVDFPKCPPACLLYYLTSNMHVYVCKRKCRKVSPRTLSLFLSFTRRVQQMFRKITQSVLNLTDITGSQGNKTKETSRLPINYVTTFLGYYFSPLFSTWELKYLQFSSTGSKKSLRST